MRSTSRQRAPREGGAAHSTPGQTEPAAVASTLDRLASEMRRAVARIGLEGEGPRALARAIDADVALSHRVLAGIRATGSASERLKQWPGAEGVQAVATKLAAAAGKPALTGPLQLAVDAYARLIRTSGGTHSKLVRAVRDAESAAGTNPSATASATEQTTSRRALSQAAAQALGYNVQLCTFVTFIRPMPGRPELLEGCSAWGMIDIKSQDAAVCITSQNTQLRDNAASLVQEVQWRPLGEPLDNRNGLLTEFCTQPTPICASDDGDGYIRQMVDPASLRRGSSVDVVLARHWSPDNNPQYLKGSPVWSQIVRMRHPAQRLLFDVYLHKSLLGSTPPTIGAYFWHPALGDDPRRQWHDRLPGSPRIELLPSDQAPTSPAWASQPALTSRLLELAAWPRHEFAGFRCDERFPLWSSAYYMTFELGRPAHG
ncbi:MAG: hypothetical protein QM783_18595 [Phycisphaerales bacterium]